MSRRRAAWRHRGPVRAAQSGLSGVCRGSEISTEERARALGLQVRALRRARKMTLDQLATLTTLNKGYLSRIEHGQKAPSIAAVVKIAEAFAVPVSTLFGEAVDDASIHIVRTARRPDTLRGDLTEAAFAPLSNAALSSGLEAFLIYPRLDFGPDGRVAHGGTEVLFVIDGRIEVQFADRTIALQKGDFLQFPGHLAHQVRRLGEAASALVVISRA